jgi:hypothetical protein
VFEGFLSPVRKSFRAMATAIVPESAQLDDAAWEDLERIVEKALSAQPESLRMQLRLLIRALNLLPVLRFGRTFRSLEAGKRALFLHGIENAPLLALRRGFWGLRTLVFLGYYGRRESGESIGYRADPRGWEARR